MHVPVIWYYYYCGNRWTWHTWNRTVARHYVLNVQSGMEDDCICLCLNFLRDAFIQHSLHYIITRTKQNKTVLLKAFYSVLRLRREHFLCLFTMHGARPSSMKDCISYWAIRQWKASRLWRDISWTLQKPFHVYKSISIIDCTLNMGGLWHVWHEADRAFLKTLFNLGWRFDW